MDWRGKVRPLITSDEIGARVAELGARIREDYAGRPLVNRYNAVFVRDDSPERNNQKKWKGIRIGS